MLEQPPQKIINFMFMVPCIVNYFIDSQRDAALMQITAWRVPVVVTTVYVLLMMGAEDTRNM
jgi:hypothetical protein